MFGKLSILVLALVGCSLCLASSLAESNLELKHCLNNFMAKLQTIELPEQVSKLAAIVKEKGLSEIYAADMANMGLDESMRVKLAFTELDESQESAPTLDLCLVLDDALMRLDKGIECMKNIDEHDVETANENKNLLGADNLLTKFNIHIRACTLLMLSQMMTMGNSY